MKVCIDTHQQHDIYVYMYDICLYSIKCHEEGSDEDGDNEEDEEEEDEEEEEEEENECEFFFAILRAPISLLMIYIHDATQWRKTPKK